MPFTLSCDRPWLVMRLPAPHRMVSWSLNRPGFVRADRIAWREVGRDELTPDLDPAAWFAGELAGAGLGDAVGLLTARNVAAHVSASRSVEVARADCVVTAGLNNGERIGTRMGAWSPAGTVNIVCRSSVPLTDAALLEAASLVAQARTMAISEAGYRRPGQILPVTGTGTDCIVMCAPAQGAAEPYAGMHTPIGEAIGAAVLEATARAVAEWIAARE